MRFRWVGFRWKLLRTFWGICEVFMKIKENRKTINKPRLLQSVGEHSSCSAIWPSRKFSNISWNFGFLEGKTRSQANSRKLVIIVKNKFIFCVDCGNTIIVKCFFFFVGKFNRAGMEIFGERENEWKRNWKAGAFKSDDTQNIYKQMYRDIAPAYICIMIADYGFVSWLKNIRFWCVCLKMLENCWIMFQHGSKSGKIVCIQVT